MLKYTCPDISRDLSRSSGKRARNDLLASHSAKNRPFSQTIDDRGGWGCGLGTAQPNSWLTTLITRQRAGFEPRGHLLSGFLQHEAVNGSTSRHIFHFEIRGLT